MSRKAANPRPQALTVRAREAIRLHASGLSMREAAERAGYSPKFASGRASTTTFKSPEAVALLAEIRAEMAKADAAEALVTRQDVLAGLLAETKVNAHRGGSTQRIKAWQAIAAIMGFNAPQKIETRDMTLQDILNEIDGTTCGLPVVP